MKARDVGVLLRVVLLFLKKTLKEGFPSIPAGLIKVSRSNHGKNEFFKIKRQSTFRPPYTVRAFF
ncbi:hypothetical protein PHSC3_001498 [Chlamydiales bacterium STE3]|nr:hypothetical protein PHSC3_001498 [Chlamydiales bacterium STE3]